MNKLVRASLISGLMTFATCFGANLADEFYFSLLLTAIFPGPVFTIVLLLCSKEQSGWRVLWFLLLGTGLYYLLVYVVFLSSQNNVLFAFKLLVCGVAGFVLLYLLYDYLLAKRRWETPVLRAACLGLLASLPATGCLLLLDLINPAEKWYSLPIRIGLFSIFPLWQYLLGREVTRTDPAFSSPFVHVSAGDRVES